MAIVKISNGEKFQATSLNDNIDELMISDSKILLRVLLLETQQSNTTFNYISGDAFIDSDGLYNTVDVANTTAIFLTNYYHNQSTFSDATIYSGGGSGTAVIRHSWDFSSSPIILTGNITCSVLKQGGAVVTFYFIIYYTDLTTSTSSTYQPPRDSNFHSNVFTVTPSTKTISHIDLVFDDTNAGTLKQSTNISFLQNQDLTVQTNQILTATTNITQMSVSIDATDISDATCEVSADNGTTWTSGNLDTMITPSVTGTQPKIRIKTGVKNKNIFAYSVVIL